jgi:4,4'-diaponeurosporenoate glycosyltransferase
MILPASLCVVGLAAGLLLLWHIPICSNAQASAEVSLSIIIPARNEECNLPRLLQSISASAARKVEVLVVDDHSTDRTAHVAHEAGATVICSEPLPATWTGKAWACYQGAQNASGDLLLFLDADTYFAAGGLERLVARWQIEGDPGLSISLLPYHRMQSLYEQPSLFFCLLMAAGAGGFGAFARARLFGQSLLIPKETYFAVDGHAAVRRFVLENLNLAGLLHQAGRRMLCLSGRGTLQMRMFPEGFSQMSDSWTKGFVHGASSSGGAVLVCAAVWIAFLWTAAILLIAPSAFAPICCILTYLLFSLQLFWLARQLGNFHFATCLLYPLPLTYYCVIFARSALRRASGQKTVWRGREV